MSLDHATPSHNVRHSRFPVALKRLLPWFFCAAIFAYLFRQIHPREMLAALDMADVPLLVLYSLIYFVAALFVDVLALKHFISRFATPITLGETLTVRGVSYIMMIINYAAAQGVFAAYLKKKHNAGVSRALGTLFFISLADVLLIFTSALVSLSFSDITFHGLALRPLAFKTVPLLYLGYALWVLFWKNTNRAFLGKWRRFRPVHWLLEHDLFLIFREANGRDYLCLFLSRTPMLFVIIGAYNFAIMAFSAHLDWIWIFLYNPLIMFISTLPLTPAGFGTSQYLAIEFFKNVVSSPFITQGLTTPENLIFSSSLIWGLLNQIYKGIFGAFCLSRSSRDLFNNNEILD